MMNRAYKRLHASGLMVLLSLILFSANTGYAADDEDGWQIDVDVMGQFVEVSKSDSSFQQDHKTGSGGELGLRADRKWENGRSIKIRGFGRSSEEEGYFSADYRKLGGYGLFLGFSNWKESYNALSGRRPETSDGMPLAGNTFPGSNDSRVFFGSGSPSTDWMNGELVFDYKPSRFFSNVYADLSARRIDGDQTLLKTGAIYTDTARGLPFDLSGLVDFSFPSRKDVDYRSYRASTGAESAVGNANWQFDLSYGNHDLVSETTEVNYFANPDGTVPADFPLAITVHETEVYKEDTELQVGKFDFAVARHLMQGVYVYGAGTFMFERSDPEPSQEVGRPGTVSPTRRTGSSKVTRYSPGVNLGMVLQPVSSIVIRGDSSFRYSSQQGRITEIRDESMVLPGDVGSATSRVDRDGYVARINLSVDAKLPNRMSLGFDTRYRFRREEVDSVRTLTIVGRLTEEEEFSSNRHRVELGPTLKARLRRGRSLEFGYRYLYEDFQVDVDKLAEQFILDDFEVERHRFYAKARGRIGRKMRGEIRLEYLNERRDMEGPQVDTIIFGVPDSGEIERESFSIVQSLYYQVDKFWTLNGSFAIRKQSIELVGDVVSPFNKSQLADFEYDAVTETLTLGASYRPTDEWSSSFSYSLFNSDRSVDNMGHTIRLAGDYRLNDSWRVSGNYGFYLYRRDGTGVDNYDAHVISLGVSTQF